MEHQYTAADTTAISAHGAYNPQDQFAAGEPWLRAVKAEGAPLDTLAGTSKQFLATFGHAAMHDAYNLEDRYTLGSAVLDDLAGRAVASAVGTLAGAAKTVLGASLEVQQRRRAPAGRADERHLSTAHGGEDPGRDRSAARVVLLQVAGSVCSWPGPGEPDQERRRRPAGAGARALLRAGFRSARRLVQPRHRRARRAVRRRGQRQPHDTRHPGSGGGQSTPRITIPAIEQNASPEKQRATVEEAIGKNRETLRQLGEDEAKASREAAEA